jgi:hypothetical protein
MSNFCFKDNKKKEECKFFMQEQKKILVCGICKPTSFVKKYIFSHFFSAKQLS